MRKPATETKEVRLRQLEAVLGVHSQQIFHRALNSTVARIFGRQLQQNVDSLEKAKALRNDGQQDEAFQLERTISLAAKWAPTEGNSHDNQTRIASSIAECFTPLFADRSPASLARALIIYRTKYLAPLRAHLYFVERRMASGNWSGINYSQVPSLAMSRIEKLFSKHDRQGFTKSHINVAEGKTSISGAALTPASLVQEADEADDEVEAQVIEEQ